MEENIEGMRYQFVYIQKHFYFFSIIGNFVAIVCKLLVNLCTLREAGEGVSTLIKLVVIMSSDGSLRVMIMFSKEWSRK